MLTSKPFVQADFPSVDLQNLAPPSKPDMTAPRLVLKQGGTMLMVNPQGLLPREPDHALGMIVDDTRGLREFNITLNGQSLVFIDGSAADGFAGTFNYENAASDVLPAHAASVQGSFAINGDVFYKLSLRNLTSTALDLKAAITFGASFEDTFVVRGSERKQRGTMYAPIILDGRSVQLGYVGLDHVTRCVSLQFAGELPLELKWDRSEYSLHFAPGETLEIQVRVAYRRGTEIERLAIGEEWDFDSAAKEARAESENWHLANARVETSDPRLNEVVQRAVADINMLRLGPLGIAAGLPQFAVPFGRDSAIAGLQTCWLMPELSRNIIVALASRQGTKYDAVTAEEPGKIMHELRTGEMVGTGEAPFGPYYGTVDATQLWLMLLSEYTAWSGDITLARDLWSNVKAAISFLRRRSRKGYITYGGRPGEALANQCWKDSFNSVVYSDGKLAVAPIAICEAQGYLYAALTGVAGLANQLGHRRYARSQMKRAAILKQRFQREFWVEKLGFVAEALDKDGRQCDVISSNPGHLLGLGILTRRQERLVAKRLMEPDMFNGWFIRTLASSEVAYNEDDYQVGAGWPHDNGIACVGMRAIGHDEDAVKLFGAHVDIASAAEDRRLHELYCGTARSESPEHPKHYNVANVPQAWAAGSILHMLLGCLNPRPRQSSLRIDKPLLPAWLEWVNISNLSYNGSSIDLHFQRENGKTTCKVTRNDKLASVRIKAS
jgi:glycogen debranching enzyme